MLSCELYPCFIRVLASSEHDVCVCVKLQAVSSEIFIHTLAYLLQLTISQTTITVRFKWKKTWINMKRVNFYTVSMNMLKTKRTMKMVKWEKKPLHPQITETGNNNVYTRCHHIYFFVVIVIKNDCEPIYGYVWRPFSDHHPVF